MMYRFLGRGPGFRAEVPAEFGATPHMRTGLLYPNGDVQWVSFWPTPLFEPPASWSYAQLVEQRDDGAELYENLEPPAVRNLVWSVPSGFLTSPFNPERHHMVDDCAKAMVVGADSAGLPTLEWSGKWGTARAVGRPVDEVVFFAGADARVETLTFSWPDNAGVTKQPGATSPDYYAAVLTSAGMKLTWSGPADLRAAIDERLAAVAKSVDG